MCEISHKSIGFHMNFSNIFSVSCPLTPYSIQDSIAEISDTFVTGHREIKLILTRKLPPYCQACIVA